MKLEDEQNRELYAILQVSPEATDEEIRKAYRYWAQVYHPDKNQDPFMNEAATVNFRRICEAYEILSDKNKRQVYDIYGMEGVNSALELGPYLDKANQIKEELEKLRRMKEHEKIAQHFRPTGTILAHLSYPHFMARDGWFKGMSMNSEVHSQLSKKTALAIGGSLEVRGNAGGSAATGVLRHQLSNHSSVEVFASAGLRGLLGVQTTRNLSVHSNASISLTRSFEDGSINLTNVWNRQLSDSTNANIHLALGPESSIAVGWQKKDENMSAAGQLQIGTSSFGASARYMHRFSPKSHGRVACKIGSNALEVEIGGGRKISDFSTVRLMYLVGIQGMFWRFELHRGGQKLILPLLISRDWNMFFAVGAFIVPSSFYFILKKTVLKPYFLRREKMKALELKEKTFAQVKEARAAAEKTQQLMRNVANRKRNKQTETNGVIVTRAMYGSSKAIKRVKSKEEEDINSVDSEVIDVTLPLNFLLNDSGELKLHDGVKKSGIMGFCDPCPSEAKQLLVEYTRGGRACEVIVDDFGELLIPLEGHKL